MRHEIIIWWSAEDDAYVVDVPELPELPGCMAHGATRQAAIKNAEDSIKLWIKTAKDDGQEIPEPRGRLVFAQLEATRAPLHPWRAREIRRPCHERLTWLGNGCGLEVVGEHL